MLFRTAVVDEHLIVSPVVVELVRSSPIAAAASTPELSSLAHDRQFAACVPQVCSTFELPPVGLVDWSGLAGWDARAAWAVRRALNSANFFL